MDGRCSGKTVVIKLGGSVLVDEESYRQAARFLVRRFHRCGGDRLLTVVSARNGRTDELEAVARKVTVYPNPRTLDLLWSTEEIRSVALLTLHLEELGVAAVGLNVHEMGLRCTPSRQAQPRVEVLSAEVHRAFDDHSVVIVPGFFGSLMSGTMVSLGRGGSDLTAVLLADEFETGRCELIKDVPGYFTQDPHTSSCATYLPWISYETAIEMAESGCELVQRVAIEAARKRGLQLVVRSLDDGVAGTVVSTHTNQQRTCATENQLAQDDFAKS
jgi:aspartate kinase